MDANAPQSRSWDRRTGLLVFGILQIVLGVVSVAVVLVVLAGYEMAQRAGGPTSGAALASAVVVYGAASAYFLAAGIGSVRGRRWARALSVAVSAIWAVGGVVAGLATALVLPRVLKAWGRPDAATFGGCVAMAILICGIALPLVFFLFYRRDDVRLTCEAMDPISRWTDRVPLPILAVVLVLGFASVALVANLANPSMVVLGRQIVGAPAALTMFALAGLCAFLAVQVYRLKESAWWTLILLQLIGVGYALVDLTRADPAAAAPPGATPGLTGIHREPFFIAIFLATWLAYFAFLLYLRRYFVLHEPRTRRDDQSTLSV